MEKAGRGRPRLPAPSGTLTPGGTRRRCTVQRTSTPGGTAGSPVEFMQQCTPADEARSARNKRLDRNRQAARFAATKAARGKMVKPTALDFERHMLASVDMEQPEQSFDMDLLDDLILEAAYSRQHDRRAAAVMLREGVADVEARIGAAVHLMVGHKYTATCKERVLCASCGRKFAVRADGLVRRHDCKSN